MGLQKRLLKPTSLPEAQRKDKHQTTEAVYIEYLGKKQLFHIIPNNFLIPEDEISEV